MQGKKKEFQFLERNDAFYMKYKVLKKKNNILTLTKVLIMAKFDLNSSRILKL